MDNTKPLGPLSTRVKRFMHLNAVLRQQLLRAEQKFLKSVGGISASQLQMILLLDKYQPCSMSFLSKNLNFSKANISQMVDRLVRDKYLKKIKRHPDQRVVEAVLLTKGENIVALNKQHAKQIAGKWFAKVTATEQLGIIRWFEQITS